MLYKYLATLQCTAYTARGVLNLQTTLVPKEKYFMLSNAVTVAVTFRERCMQLGNLRHVIKVDLAPLIHITAGA